MELKVLRSCNYGKVMKSVNENDYFHKFYFSFFELNNGNIISVMKIENFKKNKLIRTENQFNYANNYIMCENFLKFWERSFDNKKKLKKNPSKKEIKLIEGFLSNLKYPKNQL